MKSRDEATLLEWNRTDVEFQSDKCIHDLLEAQALRTPEKTAVVCRDRSLTYAALHQRARVLPTVCARRALSPETIVAILMDRSLDTWWRCWVC